MKLFEPHAFTRTLKQLRPHDRRSWIRLAFYAFIVAASVWLDNDGLSKWMEQVVPVYGIRGHRPCGPQEARAGSWIEELFQPLLARGLHASEPRHVVLVTISPEVEPLSIMTNTCDGRKFFTRLLNDLYTLKPLPKVIAIDKFYSDGSCPDPTINNDFSTALKKAGSVGVAVPVVVGQATHERHNQTAVEDCMVATPKFSQLPANVQSGLTLLNGNSLKIPLTWWIFADDAEARNKKVTDNEQRGFALVAAERADPRLRSDHSIRELRHRFEHPYAPLVDFTTATSSATNILCQAERTPAIDGLSLKSCDQVAPQPVNFENKVVVIGELSDSDLQPVSGSEAYGVELQASYIEDLLDRHYVHAMPPYIEDVLIALSYLVLYFFDEMLDLGLTKRIVTVFIPLLACLTLIVISLAALLEHYFAPELLLASLPLLAFFIGRGISWLREETALSIGQGERK